MAFKLEDFPDDARAAIQAQLDEEDRANAAKMRTESSPERRLSAIPPCETSADQKPARDVSGRRTPNKAEREWAANLEIAKAGGVIRDYWFEPFGLRLGHRCVYYPDFLSLDCQNRITIWDVKAWWGGPNRVGIQEDARVKLYACSSLFPDWEFKIVWKRGKSWEQRLIPKEKAGTVMLPKHNDHLRALLGGVSIEISRMQPGVNDASEKADR